MKPEVLFAFFSLLLTTHYESFADSPFTQGESATRTTQSSPIPVPYDWLEKFNLVNENDYETAAMSLAANGRLVWECYLAGLTPTNASDHFSAIISIKDGSPIVSYYPQFVPHRIYGIQGKEKLTDPWGPTNTLSRFFRAIVKLPVYTVVFEANGGIGHMSSQIIEFDKGTSLVSNCFSRIGYSFLGWNFETNLIQDGEVVTNLSSVVDSSIVLSASWAPISYKIIFDPNDGQGNMPALDAIYDKETVLPACSFSYAEHSFQGWSLSPTSTNFFLPGSSILLNLTQHGEDGILYANWKSNSTERLHFKKSGYYCNVGQWSSINLVCLGGVPPYVWSVDTSYGYLVNKNTEDGKNRFVVSTLPSGQTTVIVFVRDATETSAECYLTLIPNHAL